VDDAITDDQRMLVDACARLMMDTYPLERVREMAYEDAAFAAAYRRRAAELGWYSMLVPEGLGGGTISGNGVLDAALIAYQRGRLLQPGAFVGTNVVAYALAAAGTEEQRGKVLPSLISGEASASWVVTDSPGAPAMDGVVSATRTGGGFRLSGDATFIEDPGPRGWFLITAAGDDGPGLFLVRADEPGLHAQPLGSLDLTRRFLALHLDALDVPRSALVENDGGAADLIDRLLGIACVLTTAESVGAMDYELAITVQYAKDRIAFGRPIGSFQAVKHSLADSSLLLEMSKAIARAAAQHLGDDVDYGAYQGSGGYGFQAASMAKAFVGDCGIDLAQSCFQTFGGIGFTWEHDQHLYLRRLTSDAAFFGDPAWHRERLCQLSGI
jgi:alkylation response protein AidB-like acyl-CoA dehydrogenase